MYVWFHRTGALVLLLFQTSWIKDKCVCLYEFNHSVLPVMSHVTSTGLGLYSMHQHTATHRAYQVVYLCTSGVCLSLGGAASHAVLAAASAASAAGCYPQPVAYAFYGLAKQMQSTGIVVGSRSRVDFVVGVWPLGANKCGPQELQMAMYLVSVHVLYLR